MTKQQVTKIASRQYGNLTNWQLDKMAIRQYGNLTESCSTISWSYGSKTFVSKKGFLTLFFFEIWNVTDLSGFLSMIYSQKRKKNLENSEIKKWESFLLFLVLFQFKMVLLFIVKSFLSQKLWNFEFFWKLLF